MSDLEIDANGDLIPTMLSWSQLSDQILRPPQRRPAAVSPRLYVHLKSRSYPEPFRYIASWTEVRRLSAIPAVPWVSIGEALDAQRR